jgi:hypothetical protein
MNEVSIYEAAGKGIDRIRLERWANKFDHIRINITGKGIGIWVKLYAPFNLECNGRDPVAVLLTQFDCDERIYVPYQGPLPDSEEYRSEVLKFKGCLSK